MGFQGIEFRNISKNFNGKVALSGIDLKIEKGSVHAIVGENGAGKSTLMNILCGVHIPSGGEIYLDEQKVRIESPADATRNGIGMVHQHFMLVNVLSVWQNIILGAEAVNGIGWLKMKYIYSEVKKACEDYGENFNLEEAVGNLTVGEQQRIEIVKVLFRKAEYIILDEPTAVLAPEEIEVLFKSIERFRAQGKTVIFISHKIEEVLRISDRITVLRRGRLTGTLERKDASSDKLVEMMVGREIHIDGAPLDVDKGKEVLKFENVCTRQEEFGAALQKLNFSVREGEVVGFAGVDGNGQLELVQAVMGLTTVTEGRIMLQQEDITNKSTQRIRRLGISCIPPDRQEQGLVLDSAISRNMVMGFENLPMFRRSGLLSPKAVDKYTETMLEAYDVRYGNITDDIRSLSGGNQQKVILARECGLAEPKLIVAANPTRGLDVGAIEFVYETLEKLKQQGKSILLVSTELPEVMRLSDRVAVLYKGKIMGIVEGKDKNLQTVGRLMMGLRKEDENEQKTGTHC